MIAYITGVLKEKTENTIVVDAGGIGYELFVSTNTLSALPLENEDVEVLTYLQVKEDGMVLYGFFSREEKGLFLKLIEVTGIGPKGAIGILSGMSISDLIVAIATEDVTSLSKIKGLGKKTAERLCLELKDKVTVIGAVKHEEEYNQNSLTEAIEALVALGLNKNHALELARSVAKRDSTVEEIITLVLQNMGR